MVCLDELVSEGDRFRRIDELVGGWGFVREAVCPYYAGGLGRPSIDPTVLLKLMLAGALEGIGSMRELLRVAALRLDLRLFLGYGLGERLPAYQTISEAQTQRFADGDVFERAVPALGLVVQGARADRGQPPFGRRLPRGGERGAQEPAGEPRAARRRSGPEPEGGPEPELPQLRLAEPRSGPTPKRKASNATAVSRTDADARLKGKPGQRPHLVYRGHVAGRPEGALRGPPVSANVPRATRATRWRRSSSVSASSCPNSSRSAPTRASLPSASGRTPRTQNRRLHPATEDDAASRGPRATHQGAAARARREDASEERARPLGLRRRMVDAEGVIAELKNHHTRDRVRCRRTPTFHVQLLLGCAAIT